MLMRSLSMPNLRWQRLKQRLRTRQERVMFLQRLVLMLEMVVMAPQMLLLRRRELSRLDFALFWIRTIFLFLLSCTYV